MTLTAYRSITLVVCILCVLHTMSAGAIDTTMKPVNLGPNINSPYDDILPVISPDGNTLFFCRGHSPDNVGGGKQDIWYSEKQSDGTWGLARNIGVALNNRDNNFLCAITPDGNTVLIGDTYSSPSKGQRSIAISRRTASGWSVPRPVVIRNFSNRSQYTEYTLANDAKTLILAADRSDSRGEKDLYVCFLQPDSTFSEPINMGDSVNSALVECTPFIASDGTTLYFASDGHGGYGAFDVFVSRRLDSTWTRWSKPENLGPTINTREWDLYYTVPAAGDYAYFVSEINSLGASDIFRIELPEKVRPRPVVLVNGRVLNKKTSQPVESNIIYEILPSGIEEGMARSAPTTGQYKIVLPAGARYGFRASAEGYLSVNDNLDLADQQEYTTITRDLFLVPIEVGSVMELKNISFEYNKAALTTDSYPELNRVAQMLVSSPSMTLEIAGHTDSKGGDDYNMRLSESRAQSVVTYLLTKSKIDAKRLIAKGYGETAPRDSNDTEAGRANNRRVEIEILTK